MTRTCLLLVALVVPAVPAFGQVPSGQDGESWASRLEGLDLAGNDRSAWAELVSGAIRTGDRDHLLGLLDSLVDSDALGRIGLRYWGALRLDRGDELPEVVEAYDRWLAEHADDREAPEAFVTVLLAHRATDAASELLDRAAERGQGAETLALPRGMVRLDRGDRVGAAEAWVEALALETGAGEAARRIVELLTDVDESETIRGIRGVLESARDDGDEAVRRRLAPLLARAWTGEGRWDEAIRSARDPFLTPIERAEALRRVAGRAGEADAWEAARRAIEAILEIGPPVAGPADRLALVEIARRSGDPTAAVRAGREAARAGVRSGRLEAAIAAVAAARRSGDGASLAEAVAEAREAGAPVETVAIAEGDLALSRGRADSALTAYDRAIPEDGRIGEEAIEAIERQRMVVGLLRSGRGADRAGEVGSALIEAVADPAGAAERIEVVAEEIDDGDPSRALLLAKAAEWRGQDGEPLRASRTLERAAEGASAGAEAPRLLLAAGSWARAGGDEVRARALWTEVATEHPDTPYALEARRLLAGGSAIDQ